MWGLFVGIAIGAGQVFALRALAGLLLGDKGTGVKLLAGLLLAAKIALIVFILYLIAGISLEHLIWAAGGMLAGLVTASAVVFWMGRRPPREE